MPTAPVLMLYDGACVFCSRSVQFILRRTDERLRFCAMQSRLGDALLRRLDMPLDNYQNLVVVDGDDLSFRSDAVIRLGQLMPWPWPQLARIAQHVPGPIRNWTYDVVARHRYRLMGRQQVCSIPHGEERLWT